uniref:Chitin-binding type-2 domain-containing protein n=1 Tax=Odontella aurita TaxID=265563 RepID=A0A7S4HIW9_9STRA|mmetsp:Transcript_10713/g.31703  ORF Transcript_10713/g.31703 Transcript_10713/m.31703 type:complete len:244 (+) Transcript_10713:505-1236(+)
MTIINNNKTFAALSLSLSLAVAATAASASDPSSDPSSQLRGSYSRRELLSVAQTPPPPAAPPCSGPSRCPNPCAEMPAGDFYSPHCDDTAEHRFLQCSAHGECWEMPCAEGTVWDDDSPPVGICNRAPPPPAIADNRVGPQEQVMTSAVPSTQAPKPKHHTTGAPPPVTTEKPEKKSKKKKKKKEKKCRTPKRSGSKRSGSSASGSNSESDSSSSSGPTASGSSSSSGSNKKHSAKSVPISMD